MSIGSIIIWGVMLLFLVVSIWVLFKGKGKSKPNIVDVPSYNNSVKNILNEGYKNEGYRITQKELRENTDYILNYFD